MRIINEKIGLWDMGYNKQLLNWKDNGKSQLYNLALLN
jgi:hypothetical protein